MRFGNQHDLVGILPLLLTGFVTRGKWKAISTVPGTQQPLVNVSEKETGRPGLVPVARVLFISV